MPVQKLYVIQPGVTEASAHDVYVGELKKLVDGPEEVVSIQMLDAPIPLKPILLVITSIPDPPYTITLSDGRQVEQR